MQRFPWLSLRNLGWIEGASLVLLLFVAMPLKYWAGYPQVVSVVGMAHGILFMLFVGWVVIAARIYEWSFKRTFLLLLTSIVPFAPFFTNFEDEPSSQSDLLTENS